MEKYTLVDYTEGIYNIFNIIFVEKNKLFELSPDFKYKNKNYHYIKEHLKEYTIVELFEILVLYDFSLNHVNVDKYPFYDRTKIYGLVYNILDYMIYAKIPFYKYGYCIEMLKANMINNNNLIYNKLCMYCISKTKNDYFISENIDIINDSKYHSDDIVFDDEKS